MSGEIERLYSFEYLSHGYFKELLSHGKAKVVTIHTHIIIKLVSEESLPYAVTVCPAHTIEVSLELVSVAAKGRNSPKKCSMSTIQI